MIGRTWAGSLTVVAALASGVAATGTSVQSATLSSVPPPANALGTAPVAALVDEAGAVLIRPMPEGGVEIQGLTRGGAVPPWRLALARGYFPLGCLRCPDVLVSDEGGGLHVVRGGVLTDLTAPAPLAEAIGLPGFSQTQGVSAVATEDAGRLAIHRLGDLAGPTEAVWDRPAAGFALTRFQQSQAAMGVTAAGRGVAVARLGALRPGTWRIQQVEGARTVLDVEMPARFATIEDHVNVAACLSPDGRRAAVVVEETGGFRVLSGAWGERPEGGHHVTSTGRVTACDVTPSGVAVAVAEGDRFSVYRVSGAGGVKEQRSQLPAETGQFCPGTGTFVAQGPAGASELRPGAAPRRLTTSGLAGCTAGGTIWTVGGKEVTWYTRSR